jgi:hypothetical protein
LVPLLWIASGGRNGAFTNQKMHQRTVIFSLSYTKRRCYTSHYSPRRYWLFCGMRKSFWKHDMEGRMTVCNKYRNGARGGMIAQIKRLWLFRRTIHLLAVAKCIENKKLMLMQSLMKKSTLKLQTLNQWLPTELTGMGLNF